MAAPDYISLDKGNNHREANQRVTRSTLVKTVRGERATKKGVGTCERKEESECKFINRIRMETLHWETL